MMLTLKSITFKKMILLLASGVLLSFASMVIVLVTLSERYDQLVHSQALLVASGYESQLRQRFISGEQTLQTLRGIVEKHNVVRDYTRDPYIRQNTRDVAYQLMKFDTTVMQLRVLNKRGVEILRLDRSDVGSMPYYVHDDELQNKADRYYFQKAMSLPRNGLEYSAIDLNVENGLIERPYKSVVRISTPIYSDSDKIEGIVVVNIFMNTFFDMIRSRNDFNIVMYDKDFQVMDGSIEHALRWHSVIHPESKENRLDLSSQISPETLYYEDHVGYLYHLRLVGDRDYYLQLKPTGKLLSGMNHEFYTLIIVVSIGSLLVLIPMFLYIVVTYNRLSKTRNNLLFMNQNLEDMVVKNSDLIIRQERMLIHQSRLAALGEMTSMIAHHWRQPLTAIGFQVQNIRDDWLSGELSKDSIETSVEQVMGLLKKLSRTIDSFRSFYSTDKEIVRFDIIEQLESAIGILAPLLESDEIELHLQQNVTGSIYMNGLPRELSQALVNILINARDAVVKKSRGAHRFINLEIIKNPLSVDIKVEDSGGGIDPAIQDKVFEPYYSSNSESHSSGLGLFLSKMIIESCFNGTIALEKGLYGARFVIQIPLSDKGRKEDEPPTEIKMELD